MALPWETPAAAPPWEIVSPLYPRTIAIHRPKINVSAGVQAYSGEVETNETVVLSGLRASIQLARHVRYPDANLPADAYSKAGFDIFIPAGASLGQIVERDIVVDDIGNRYQVTGADWDILGFNLSTELMQA